MLMTKCHFYDLVCFYVVYAGDLHRGSRCVLRMACLRTLVERYSETGFPRIFDFFINILDKSLNHNSSMR